MPEPYYSDEAVTIYHGDCRDILPSLPKVDLVLTDPPYGIEGGRGVGNRRRGKAAYSCDGWQDTPEYIADVCVPVIKQLVSTVAVAALTPGIRHMHLYLPADDIGCFWTPATMGMGSWGMTTFQPILYYGKDPRRGVAPLPSGKQVTEAPNVDGHPCPKPIGAWKWLLNKLSASEKDTVLDPFMGSGTTLVAAKYTGRRAIGIEIEERYCEIAANRCRQMVMTYA
jgi:site-specific DNA-methyltransferase (adenine-specific)